ncbi:MAG TPA: MerC family mercury resistance protein [Nitrospirae bacterium]|nr:MerC family mercury resistance protein [Nitrospirota bacterium]
MNNNTSAKPARLSWLGSATSLVAVVACYGTVAAVALLSLVGVSVKLDESFMVKLITGLLILALLGMGNSFRLHRHAGPLLLSLAAAAVLFWVFYGSYSKPLELTGFAVLLAASVWDFRVKKRSCVCSEEAHCREKCGTPPTDS